jgi:phosphonate transport system substrate-binding protein
MLRVLTIVLFIVFSSPSHAAELTIGLIPEQNVFKQVSRFKPLGEYIEKKTGIRIRFTMLSKYGNIIDRFSEDQMDGAFWGSFTGALAIKSLGIEPIARPVWFDGSSTYKGLIIVRKDSHIRNVEDMRGRSIAFVDKATTAGYIFPMAYLKEYGVEGIDAYFKDHFFTGSHDASVHAVLERTVDIGCVKNTIFNMLVSDDNNLKEELIVLAESPEVPSNGLGLRKDLDGGVKNKLRNVLITMHGDREGIEVLKRFGAGHFIETTEEDYYPVFDMTRRAGIDIMTYSYYNR